MQDRCLFIQHEIGCCFIDDFMVLPHTELNSRGCVIVMGLSDAVKRHDDMFFLTH